MENYKSRDLLTELHTCMLKGEELSKKLSWKSIGILVTLFLLLIGLPMFYLGLDCFANPSSYLGKIVFVIRLVVVVLCAIYTWIILHIRKVEIHGFQRVAREIEVKIRFLDSLNSKKSD